MTDWPNIPHPSLDEDPYGFGVWRDAFCANDPDGYGQWLDDVWAGRCAEWARDHDLDDVWVRRCLEWGRHHDDD
jgi:hypothetical protein